VNGNCTIVSVAFDLLAISTADNGSLNHARCDVFRLLATIPGRSLLLDGCHRNGYFAEAAFAGGAGALMMTTESARTKFGCIFRISSFIISSSSFVPSTRTTQ
jgi:hypothetical protein